MICYGLSLGNYGVNIHSCVWRYTHIPYSLDLFDTQGDDAPSKNVCTVHCVFHTSGSGFLLYLMAVRCMEHWTFYALPCSYAHVHDWNFGHCPSQVKKPTTFRRPDLPPCLGETTKGRTFYGGSLEGGTLRLVTRNLRSGVFVSLRRWTVSKNSGTCITMCHFRNRLKPNYRIPGFTLCL